MGYGSLATLVVLDYSSSPSSEALNRLEISTLFSYPMSTYTTINLYNDVSNTFISISSTGQVIIMIQYLQ